ncbi:MAG: hypothetical protein WD749_05810 [Phycisphaerales bacterium]
MPTRWPLTNADQVRRYVALTGATCPSCRYSLRGLRHPTCPECGAHLTVESLARPRGLAAARAAILGTDKDRTLTPLRFLALLNILIAAAILASALSTHGELPLLSWLAPGVLGAFAFSLQYFAVFARHDPIRHDPFAGWAEGIAGVILITQSAGLILMWV